MKIHCKENCGEYVSFNERFLVEKNFIRGIELNSNSDRNKSFVLWSFNGEKYIFIVDCGIRLFLVH